MNKAFMSDNTAPVDVRIMQAVVDANNGFAKPYGYDDYTLEAEELIRKEFGDTAQFYPVLNGTGANVLSLANIMQPFHAVVCAETAHINVDECGAPERFLGSKLIDIKTEDGKLRPEDISSLLQFIGDEHHSQPYVISVAQSTEAGTVYSLEELAALSAFAKDNKMLFHIDGSRMANAAVFLGCSLGEMVKDADIISFGGTKNGMMLGDAIVILNPEIGAYMRGLRKQSMQHLSKMRYASAQYIPYLRDKIWRENALTANTMARKLAKGFEDAGFEFKYHVQGNALFVYLSKDMIQKLEDKIGFYVWDAVTGLCRFMCSFATTQEDVDELLSLI